LRGKHQQVYLLRLDRPQTNINTNDIDICREVKLQSVTMKWAAVAYLPYHAWEETHSRL